MYHILYLRHVTFLIRHFSIHLLNLPSLLCMLVSVLTVTHANECELGFDYVETMPDVIKVTIIYSFVSYMT